MDLTDSHAHLDDGSFDPDRAEVMQRAAEAGVRRVVVPAIHRDSWAGIERLCRDYPQALPAYGLHPIYLEQHRPEHVAELTRWLKDHPAVAVGEIGLDFFLEELDHERQRSYFEQQLHVAREFDLPVIVHARRAMDEVTATLRRIGGLRGVVHSFAGSEQQAEQLWRLGFCLGIGGPVTYERAQRLRRIVAGMPLDYLLLETDAPDQPGAGHRGQRNEPAHLIEVLRVVAQLRGDSAENIAAATSANAAKLFGCR
ncbi:TatD family hydrolase [Dyella sp. LX-66]|uniref:TatD family hydrolase n=1 Tax=unclassified Dyella TaxID=2634549 RepID=UPI001BE08530|nr:TatD family hydrolase [Dyella sp. LX-1]MBT2139081.1 TatD family hydrolase [Dyella sp. LX-66]